jgi:streptogramin lyase
VKIYLPENPEVFDISGTQFALVKPPNWGEEWLRYGRFDGPGGNTNWNMWTVAADNDGGVWAGSMGYGAGYFDGTVWTRYTTDNSGLAFNDVRTVCVDHDGVVWFGAADENTVSRYDHGVWTTFREKAYSLILDIEADHDNNIWFGTDSDGVTVFNGQEWRHHTFENSIVRMDNTQTIEVDPKNNVWVCGKGKRQGFAKYNGSEWVFYPNAAILIDSDLTDIAFEPGDAIWFATWNGLLRFDSEKDLNPQNYYGPFYNNIMAITFDQSGGLWVISRDFISNFDGKEWKDYTSENSAYISSPINIAIDTKNRVWFSGWGVIRYDGDVGPYAKMLYPNYSELLLSGGPLDIKWLSNDVPSVTLEFSPDNGENWQTVASGLNADRGQYAWELPDIESRDCRMRITADSDPSLSDMNDKAFRLSRPFVEITLPNGGEMYPDPRWSLVRWISIGVDFVDIELSDDGGETWQLLTERWEAAEKVYAIEQLNVQSSHCLVRISDSSNPVINDISDGVFSYNGETTVSESTPIGFSLSQNSPNPFNPSTTVSFTLPAAEHATVEVFNISGQRVATLADGIFSAGRHSLVWNAGDNSAGIYFCRVRAGANMRTVKMALVK